MAFGELTLGEKIFGEITFVELTSGESSGHCHRSTVVLVDHYLLLILSICCQATKKVAMNNVVINDQ